MAQAAYNVVREERRTLSEGYVFGAPVKDLGWFASLVMGVAAGMAAFFAATFVGIVSILFWNASGHHADFGLSYRVIGLPVGTAVMALSLAYLGTFWAKRIFRKS